MKLLLTLAILFTVVGCNTIAIVAADEQIQYAGQCGDTITLTDSSFVWTNFPLEFFTGETLHGTWIEDTPIQYPDYDTSDNLPGPIYNRKLFTPDSCEGWEFYIPYKVTPTGFYYPIYTDGKRGYNYKRIR